MKVYFTPEFINDLRHFEGQKFVRHVFNHTLSTDGTFISDSDDHRYEGIDNAWIRYVSKGKTAYRVIYVIDKGSVYLYRAGHHNIEDNLKQPKNFDLCIPINSKTANVTKSWQDRDIGKLLSTTEPEYVSRYFEAMYHIKHDKIYLISPFISKELIDSKHHFGNFLDKAVEENTEVYIVTRPPDDDQIPIYRKLAERTIFVLFNKNLHAKLYLFDVNTLSLSKYNQDVNRTAILGSSNLTKVGIGFDDFLPNDELCYRLPIEKYQRAYEYAERLIAKSIDFDTYIFRKKRR